MKKSLVLIFAAVMVMCLAACDYFPDPPDIPPPPPDWRPGGGEANELMADEAPVDEAAPTESEQFVTGTVVYYDGATLALCSQDNINLHFLVADDAIDLSELRELTAGSKADVYYTGEIKGGNTSAAQVTRLKQSPEQAAGTDVSVVGGIIASADVYALSILSFSGEELNFSIGSGEIYMKPVKELAAGDYVAVFYDGELVSGDGSSVSVLKVV